MNTSNFIYSTENKEYILDILDLASRTSLIAWSHLQLSNRILKFSLVNTNSNY